MAAHLAAGKGLRDAVIEARKQVRTYIESAA
jgi:hypothetical protein